MDFSHIPNITTPVPVKPADKLSIYSAAVMSPFASCLDFLVTVSSNPDRTVFHASFQEIDRRFFKRKQPFDHELRDFIATRKPVERIANAETSAKGSLLRSRMA